MWKRDYHCNSSSYSLYTVLSWNYWDYFDSSISPVVEVYSKHGCSINEDAAYPYYHDMGPRDTRNMVDEGLRRGYHFGFVASTDHHAGFPFQR